MRRARIGHLSTYADDPHAAATALAQIVGGHVSPFKPLEGGWLCVFTDEPPHEFVEFYPRSKQLAFVAPDPFPKFVDVPGGRAVGAGTHINLVLPMSEAEIEAACSRAGKPHGWRSRPRLMDVWLENNLLVELVPASS